MEKTIGNILKALKEKVKILEQYEPSSIVYYLGK